MKEDITLVNHITTWSELVLVVSGLIGATWLAIKKIYRIAKNIEKLVDNSEEHTVRLAEIEKQVAPNGGKSLRDAVERIENRLDRLEQIPCHVLPVVIEDHSKQP